jgi:hypothetical protein
MLEAIVASFAGNSSSKLHAGSLPLVETPHWPLHPNAQRQQIELHGTLKGGSPMTKKVGILSLVLAAGMAVLQPAVATAQDRGGREHNFRDQAPRREERVRRGEERHDFRSPAGRLPEWHSAPYVGRSYAERPYGYVYAAPRYNNYYEPARPCR